VLAVAFGLVLATDRVRRRFERAGPGPERGERAGPRQCLGVITLTAAGAAVGLEGPRETPMAVAWTALFAMSWWLLSEPRRAGPSERRKPVVLAEVDRPGDGRGDRDRLE
jgi:hypothetical protein